jgi:hypothetical protein
MIHAANRRDDGFVLDLLPGAPPQLGFSIFLDLSTEPRRRGSL